jgi:hypothetical protein
MYVLQSPCSVAERHSPNGAATTVPDPGSDPAKSCPIEVPYFYSFWWNGRTTTKGGRYDRAYPNITVRRSTEYVITAPPQPTTPQPQPTTDPPPPTTDPPQPTTDPPAGK